MSGLYIKLCGLRTELDVQAAIDAGADAIGLVLVPSVRQVSLARAARLAAFAAGRVQVVAVVRTVDAEAAHNAVAIGANVIQGAGSPALPAGLTHLRAYRDAPGLVIPNDRVPVLIDGPRAGSGVPADWARVAAIAATRPVVLAGGLCPRTVADALHQVPAMGVDVSSGLENAPGHKDPARIFAFVAAARAAHSTRAHRTPSELS